ncbi:MAG: YihY/virulence factor BrkB family protein [Calditrichaeota bacterium]|nr:YihY/virulence factor BrkB family protein [Calditrichota bacterium]
MKRMADWKVDVAAGGDLLLDISRRPWEVGLETIKLIAGSLTNFFRTGGLVRASALAYATLLSLIPLLGLVVVLFKLVGGFDWLEQQLLPLLNQFLSPAGSESVTRVLAGIFDNLDLGTLGLFGTLFLAMGVYSLVTTIEKDFNGIWRVSRNRGILQRVSRYWLLMTLLPILAGLAIFLSGQASVIALVDVLPDWMRHSSGRLVPIMVQSLGFWFLYWGLPNTTVRTLPAAGGAIFAAISWEFAKYGFALYTLRAGNYNLVYGSLAALPLLMIWIYVSWVITLVGAEMTYVIQNRHALLRMRDYHAKGRIPYYLIGLACMNEVACAFRESRRIGTERLAQSLAIPLNELRPVLQSLETSGLLVRGDVEGHESLLPGRPLTDISMEHVVELFVQDPRQLGEQSRSPRLGRTLAAFEGAHLSWMEHFRPRTFDKDLSDALSDNPSGGGQGNPGTAA